MMMERDIVSKVRHGERGAESELTDLSALASTYARITLIKPALGYSHREG
jgi:hypothetical protein